MSHDRARIHQLQQNLVSQLRKRSLVGAESSGILEPVFNRMCARCLLAFIKQPLKFERYNVGPLNCNFFRLWKLEALLLQLQGNDRVRRRIPARTERPRGAFLYPGDRADTH